MLKLGTIKKNIKHKKQEPSKPVELFFNENDTWDEDDKCKFTDSNGLAKFLVDGFDWTSIDNEEYELILGEHNMQFVFNGLPTCCGIGELGELQDGNTPITVITKFLDEMASHLKNKTLMINTNGRGGALAFDKALMKTKSFKLIKTFKNTSGNTVKIWLSNNE